VAALDAAVLAAAGGVDVLVGGSAAAAAQALWQLLQTALAQAHAGERRQLDLLMSSLLDLTHSQPSRLADQAKA
jgi:hypothetical protein